MVLFDKCKTFGNVVFAKNIITFSPNITHRIKKYNIMINIMYTLLIE